MRKMMPVLAVVFAVVLVLSGCSGVSYNVRYERTGVGSEEYIETGPIQIKSMESLIEYNKLIEGYTEEFLPKSI